MAAQTVVAGASLVFEVSIALELLDLGESGVGVLSSVLGVGGIIGGFVALLLARRGRIAGDFGYGVLLWAAPLLLIVVAPTLAATAAAFFIIGLANSLVDVNAYTIIQRVTPTEVMGRVFGALESLLTGGMAIGALLMPVLINTVGLRAGLAVIGGAVAVLAIAGLPVLRRLDTTVLAPPGWRCSAASRCWRSFPHRSSSDLLMCSCRWRYRRTAWCSARATPATGSG